MQIGSSGPPPRNRASPSRLFLLNSGLDDTQKDAISDISFGGVLDIRTRTMKGDALFLDGGPLLPICIQIKLSNPLY